MIHLGVFFGSNTVEHEISVITAIQAIEHLKKLPNYKIVPVYVSKSGDTYTGDALFDMDNFKNLEKLKTQLTPITLVKGNQVVQLLEIPFKALKNPVIDEIHVAFPIFHGSFGEDGTFQGLFELLDIPYVGCDVLSAATTMDKIASKLIMKECGIPVVDYYWLNANEWIEDPMQHMLAIEKQFTYPVIVKPANTGSSIGVSVAHNRDELESAINLVRKFSNRILIEYMVQNIMEVNISVLGDSEHAEVSLIERPITAAEFLTFKDKYESNSKTEGMSSAKREIPAILPDGMKESIEAIALKAFKVLDCSGVSRLDFIIDQSTGTVYLNELNTIPGSLSFYLWEPTGIPYPELLERLIGLAHSKHRRKKRLIFSNNTNILSGVDLKGIKK
ncbi:MAG: D-alanine--D-alanine ligase [Clostridia bacterium]|nr:D-alanine--D-alanine ligase [Clostridia bacterium]